MVIILGLNSYNKDSSAAIVKDDKIITCVEEERFNQKKHYKGFPRMSIAYCLKRAGIRLKDIDLVAGNGEKDLVKRYPFMGMKIKDRGYHRFRNKAYEQGMHHLGHAASAFRISPFKDASIMTVDNQGDHESIAFFEGKDEKIQRIWDIDFRKISLGMIYYGFTEKLGFGEFGEGKTMGLASYGKPRKDYNRYFFIRNHRSIINDYSTLFNSLHQRVQPGSLPARDVLDLTATLQKALEESVKNLLIEAYDHNGIRDFCLAGGIFLNSKLNGELQKLDFIRGLCIQPNSGDGGISLGNAMEHSSYFGNSRFRFNVYTGPRFSDECIKNELQKQDLEFEHHDDIASVSADLLAKDKTIGFFQDRMEWGPRALGARSILAHPGIKENTLRVNRIKKREFWRPLAPSILEEEKENWFEDARESPYMLICFKVKEERTKEIPAVTHIDSTTRPQTLKEQQNPTFYRLIREFRRQTGLPMVLNTSFNEKDMPIVCTPRDAVASFLRMGLDYLAIGNYLVKQSMSSSHRSRPDALHHKID
jgi:carbamoyltransferase